MDHCRIIHIVGLYKCGTTWLLRALAAHPEIVAWREFDPLQAAYETNRDQRLGLHTAADYLLRRPTEPSWMRRREAATPRSTDEAFRAMFLGRGWLPMMGEDLQQQAEDADSGALDALLEDLLALGNFRTRPADAMPLDPAVIDRPLGVAGMRRADLLDLMTSVRSCTDTQDVPGLFYQSLSKQVRPGSRIVCKAADQLMMLDRLRALSPALTPIAIIRDGRDAAVSARHFEQLMREQQAPWCVPKAGTLRRLTGWAVRAAKLQEHVRRGDIIAVRYEDLHRDFSGTLRALLSRLQLTHSASVLESMEEKSRFSAVSGGREAGDAAAAVLRKGVVGDWKRGLSRSEAALAWRLIGRELAAFGYSRDGAVVQSGLVLSPDPSA